MSHPMYYLLEPFLAFLLHQFSQQLQIKLYCWIWLGFNIPCIWTQQDLDMFKIDHVSCLIQYTIVLYRSFGNPYIYLSCSANALNSFKSNCTIGFGLNLVFLVHDSNICSKLIISPHRFLSNTL